MSRKALTVSSNKSRQRKRSKGQNWHMQSHSRLEITQIHPGYGVGEEGDEMGEGDRGQTTNDLASWAKTFACFLEII